MTFNCSFYENQEKLYNMTYVFSKQIFGQMITEDYHTVILLTFDEVDLMIYQPWRFDIHRGERLS